MVRQQGTAIHTATELDCRSVEHRRLHSDQLQLSRELSNDDMKRVVLFLKLTKRE